ncbi:hypothetical protein WJX77_012451, partial [Trebouxia sp. C0004]
QTSPAGPELIAFTASGSGSYGRACASTRDYRGDVNFLHRSGGTRCTWSRDCDRISNQDRLQPWCKSTTPPIDTCSAMTPSVCFKVSRSHSF